MGRLGVSKWKEKKKKKTLNWLKGIFGHSGEDAVKVHERGIYLGETVLSLKCLILGFVFFFCFMMLQQMYIILLK